MINLVNVVNSLDDKEAPVGHELKVLGDYSELFGKSVQVIAAKEYISGKGKNLPYCIYAGKRKWAALKILCNYFVSLAAAKGRYLIYTVTPEELLWGIALYKGRKKVIAVTYEHWDMYISNNLADKPIRRALVKRGLSRLNGCIVTNALYRPKVPYVRIPDYYITDEIKKYHRDGTEKGCVCLGEMRNGKDILGLVRVMGKTDIPLMIAGSFQDKELYRRVKRIQADNVTIEDRNLPYDVYLKYLSECRYVVLPYDARRYDGKTSGVLLEGIFMGAVPVAPWKLLEQNGIQGLGYHNISEIPELIRLYEEGKIIVKNKMDKYCLQQYKKKTMWLLKQLDYNV